MASALSWVNLARTLAVSTPSYSGATGSVDANWPASNLLTPWPQRATRYGYNLAGNAYEYAVIDFGGTAVGPFRAFAALNCRLVASGTGGFFSFGFTNAAQSVYFGQQSFTLSSLVAIPGTTDRFNLYGLLAADITCNKIELLFRPGATASGANYFEVGHIWAGPALVFDGSDAPWSADAVISPQGQPRTRIALPFSARSYAEMMGTPGTPSAPSMFNLIHEVADQVPMLAVHRSGDAHAVQRCSVFGTITQRPKIQHQVGEWYQTVSSLEITQRR